MKAFVFIGPSLPVKEAKKYCEAEFLAPVELGQITRLLQYKPQVIGIIDGYFDSVPAVWHKEILFALSQGVHVVGGASMGALRAAELHPFGMEGTGEIFEWYRNGVIEADDEVAVVHTTAENNYQSFTEPMVNIRKTLVQALDDNIVDEPAYNRLIEAARQTFYKKRTYHQLLADARTAGISPEMIASLEAYLPDHKIDLKKQDAIHVLQRVEEIRHSNKPLTVNFDLVQPKFFMDLIDKNQVVENFMDRSIDIQDLTNHARIEWEDFPDFRLRALTNLVLLQYADQKNISLTQNEIEKGRDDFLAHLGISEKDIEGWITRNHIPASQFEQYMQDWLLLHKVKSMAQGLDNRTLLWQARLENKFEHLLMQVKEELINANHADSQEENKLLSEATLLDYFREKMHLAPSADIMDYAHQLGFTNKHSFILSLLKSYLAQQDRPE